MGASKVSQTGLVRNGMVMVTDMVMVTEWEGCLFGVVNSLTMCLSVCIYMVTSRGLALSRMFLSLCLPVSACVCLCLHVPACVCLRLSVSVCLCPFVCLSGPGARKSERHLESNMQNK